MNDESTLHALRQRVPESIAKDAASFAIIEASTWPYGTYSPNDLTAMFEKGYLAGYLKVQTALTDSQKECAAWRWVPEILAGQKFDAPKDAADYLRNELQTNRGAIESLKEAVRQWKSKLVLATEALGRLSNYCECTELCECSDHMEDIAKGTLAKMKGELVTDEKESGK